MRNSAVDQELDKGGCFFMKSAMARSAYHACINITKHVLRYCLNRVIGAVQSAAFHVFKNHVKPFILIMQQARGHRLALFLMLEWTRILDTANTNYRKLKGRNFRFFSPFRTSFVRTTYGAFYIRSHSKDFLICSPVYELEDRDYLLTLISRLRKENKRVLFLDIGSSFGIYTIFIGNLFTGDKDVRIMSFEPAGPSYELLIKNIERNNLSNKIIAHNFALSDGENDTAVFHYDPYWANSGPITPGFEHVPAAFEVELKTLDSVIATVVDYDVAIMKIDVEGAEIRVLKGAVKTLNSGKDFYLLVEDTVTSGLGDYLEGIGASPIGKFTENSWWYLRSD